jgi:predicted nucleic acid-binding protein
MIPNRVVLDTNVCLDLFVFGDARWGLLAAALQDNAVEAVTRADCRAEWQLVLAYPCFALTPAQQAACSARFDAAVRCLPAPAAPAAPADASLPSPAPLPRCTDTDDQKFLETARDTGASTLITKDKALLKLAGKCRRAGMFAILKPEAWCQSWSAATARTETRTG